MGDMVIAGQRGEIVGESMGPRVSIEMGQEWIYHADIDDPRYQTYRVRGRSAHADQWDMELLDGTLGKVRLHEKHRDRWVMIKGAPASQKPEVRVGQVWRYTGTEEYHRGTNWRVTAVTDAGTRFELQRIGHDRVPWCFSGARADMFATFALNEDCPRDPPVEVGQVWEIANVRCEVVERDDWNTESWIMREILNGTTRHLHVGDPGQRALWRFVSHAPPRQVHLDAERDRLMQGREVNFSDGWRVRLRQGSNSLIPQWSDGRRWIDVAPSAEHEAKLNAMLGLDAKVDETVKLKRPKPTPAFVYGVPGPNGPPGGTEITWSVHDQFTAPMSALVDAAAAAAESLRKATPPITVRAGQVRRCAAGEFTVLTRQEVREHWTRLRAPTPAVSEYVSGPTTDRDEVVWLLTQAMGERREPEWKQAVGRLMPEPRRPIGLQVWQPVETAPCVAALAALRREWGTR